MRTGLILILIMTTSVSGQNAPEKPRADVIFTHGNVYTGIVDPTSMVAGKRAEAIAVRGDRILAVGIPDVKLDRSISQHFEWRDEFYRKLDTAAQKHLARS